MGNSVLLVDKSDGVVTLTLNRAAAMNALSAELRAALIAAFDDVQRDRDVQVVILTGAGRAFCAGLDLKELGSAGADPEVAVSGTDLVRAVETCTRPVIGAINGVAVTGGFELALACDVLVASTAARFADTHARVGILPGWGLSQKLARVLGIYRAKEVSLTGNYLAAEQAAAWGLVNRVVAPEELLPVCRAIARDMMSCVPDVMRAYKRLIDEGYAGTFTEGLALESRAANEQVRQVSPADIAARRAAIQVRGRQQAG